MKTSKFLIFLLLCCFTQYSSGMYCEAGAYNSSYEWIDKINLSFYNHESGNDGGFGDYTSAPIFSLTQGECYFIGLHPGYSSSGETAVHWVVWIDFNQDGDFYDYAEEVYSTAGIGPIAGGLGTQVDVIHNALVGHTRMRVAMRYGSVPNACGDFYYGEVEDYTVYIRGFDFVCDSRGYNTNYEWIESIDQDGLTKVTGDNNGFNRDFCWNFGVYMGGSFTYTLTPGFPGSSYYESWKVWIDYNHNNSFEDPGELILNGVSNNGPVTFTYSPPFAVQPNISYRIRFSMKYSTAASNSCLEFNWGEVEDYTLFISDPFGLATFVGDAPSMMAKKNPAVSPPPRHSLQETRIFPNPATHWTNLEWASKNQAPTSIALFDGAGQLVRNYQPEISNTQKLDLSGLLPGTYVLHINYPEEIEILPLVVIQP